MSYPKMASSHSERSRLRLSPLLDPARRAEVGQFMTPVHLLK